LSPSSARRCAPRFYAAHRGQPAGMQDMIDLIQTKTGFDPSQIVTDRLREQF
jgi:hypothetical protein